MSDKRKTTAARDRAGSVRPDHKKPTKETDLAKPTDTDKPDDKTDDRPDGTSAPNQPTTDDKPTDTNNGAADGTDTANPAPPDADAAPATKEGEEPEEEKTAPKETSRLRRWLGLEQGAMIQLRIPTRKVYPAIIDGKIRYIPKIKDATPQELVGGFFVKEDGAETVNGQTGHEIASLDKLLVAKSNQPDDDKKDDNDNADFEPIWDPESQRMLFPISTREGDKEGEVIYVPRKSDATEEEIAQSRFREDEAVAPLLTDELIATAKQKAEQENSTENGNEDEETTDEDTTSQTNTSTTEETTSGTVSTDTPTEGNTPQQGFRHNTNGKPQKDEKNNRMLYPALSPSGEHTNPLPLEKDATELEKATGQFLPNDSVETEKAANPRSTDTPQERQKGRAERTKRLEKKTA